MYYFLNIIWYYKNSPPVGKANGTKILNGKEYLFKIDKGEIIENVPLFDYFFLDSYAPSNVWDWKLHDVYSFSQDFPLQKCLLVSNAFKSLLNRYNLPASTSFYPCKLKFKDQKLDYYVFKFNTGTMANLNYNDCLFEIENFISGVKENVLVKCHSYEDYFEQNKILNNKGTFHLKPKKLAFNSKYDFVALTDFNSSFIISEQLKQAIEKVEIEGLEIKPTNYEVIMPDK